MNKKNIGTGIPWAVVLNSEVQVTESHYLEQPDQ